MDVEQPSVCWSEGVDAFNKYILGDEMSSDVQGLLTGSQDWYLAHFTNDYSVCNKVEDKELSYKIEKLSNGIRIYSDASAEHWVYFFSKEQMPSVYRLEFDYIPHTVFNEQIQIDFAAKSLADRHRFILEFNDRFYYQIIRNAFFLPRLAEISCSLPLHKVTHICFEKIKNIYSISVNGETLMCKRNQLHSSMVDRSFLLFWNGSHSHCSFQEMDFEILNFVISFPKDSVSAQYIIGEESKA